MVAANVRRARFRSCSTARRTTWTRAASLRADRASSSLISPARRRASVIPASRCTRSAFSIVSCKRRSAISASACAARVCATSVSASQTSRSPTACALSCAAATRRGRCHKASNGNCSVHSSCLGPQGNRSENTGFRSRPASTRSARASPRSASVAWNEGLFHSAIATASCDVRPSSTDASGGTAAAPSMRMPLAARARIAVSTVLRSGACPTVAHALDSVRLTANPTTASRRQRATTGCVIISAKDRSVKDSWCCGIVACPRPRLQVRAVHTHGDSPPCPIRTPVRREIADNVLVRELVGDLRVHIK